MVPGIINNMPGDDPVYCLFFQMGSLIHSIPRGRFFLRVALNAECGWFYTRFFRREDNFRQILGVSTSNSGTRVGISSTRQPWGLHIYTITSLYVNSSQRAFVSSFFISICHRRLISRLVRLRDGVPARSTRACWRCIFRGVMAPLSSYSFFRQRLYSTLVFIKGHHMGRNGSTSSTRVRRSSRGGLEGGARLQYSSGNGPSHSSDKHYFMGTNTGQRAFYHTSGGTASGGRRGVRCNGNYNIFRYQAIGTPTTSFNVILFTASKRYARGRGNGHNHFRAAYHKTKQTTSRRRRNRGYLKEANRDKGVDNVRANNSQYSELGGQHGGPFIRQRPHGVTRRGRCYKDSGRSYYYCRCSLALRAMFFRVPLIYMGVIPNRGSGATRGGWGRGYGICHQVSCMSHG